MRHTEFLISLGWRKPTEGSYPRVRSEGFHLTMGWANEGVAEWLCQDQRVSPEQVVAIARHIADVVVVPETGLVTLIDQAAEFRANRVKYLKATRDKAAEELKELEGA